MPHSTALTKENLAECANVKRLLSVEKHRIGMTHRTLGKMIGKSDKTISAIVNGRMRVTVPVARKLAKVFGVPLADILPWTADLADSTGEMAEFIEHYRDLDLTNRKLLERMMLNLLESQAKP